MNCALDFVYNISQKEVKKIWMKWESLINLSLKLNKFDATKHYAKLKNMKFVLLIFPTSEYARI